MDSASRRQGRSGPGAVVAAGGGRCGRHRRDWAGHRTRAIPGHPRGQPRHAVEPGGRSGGVPGRSVRLGAAGTAGRCRRTAVRDAAGRLGRSPGLLDRRGDRLRGRTGDYPGEAFVVDDPKGLPVGTAARRPRHRWRRHPAARVDRQRRIRAPGVRRRPSADCAVPDRLADRPDPGRRRPEHCGSVGPGGDAAAVLAQRADRSGSRPRRRRAGLRAPHGAAASGNSRHRCSVTASGRSSDDAADPPPRGHLQRARLRRHRWALRPGSRGGRDCRAERRHRRGAGVRLPGGRRARNPPAGCLHRPRPLRVRARTDTADRDPLFRKRAAHAPSHHRRPSPRPVDRTL